MEKKKIAFVHYQIVVGGISVALIRLIQALDSDKYDITLFLGVEKGKNECMIPEHVHIKYHYIDNYREIIRSRIKQGQIAELGHAAVYRSLMNFCSKSSQAHERLYYSTRRYPLCDDTVYDCVIAFNHEQMETVVTALYRISAKKRILWVHSEFLGEKVNYSFLYKQYRRFDRIYCVSESLKVYFDTLYPKLSSRTDAIVNQIDAESIISKSKERCLIEITHPAILTVGHINRNKGSHLIPKTVDLLVKSGYDVHWYLVGDIHDNTLLTSEIAKYGIEDRVIFCGLQSNPYPFFRECDIYVQPSYVEGYGFTVAEAKILCKPIVTTPFKTSFEQIQDGINGLIAKGHTSEALYGELKKYLDNSEFMMKCAEDLKATQYDSKKELIKLYDYIESNE